MKSHLDPLHQLIRSLSKGEKRSFKIYASRHVLGEENNYVKLFDAIEKQEVYDEAALLKKFKNEKFIKRLVVAKSYLNDTILKCLTQLHAGLSIPNQIKESLITLSFLYEKGLHQQAEKLLQKIKKQALQYHQLHILPEIANWERKILEATHFSDTTQEAVENFIKESKNTLLQILNINEYWDLQAHLYVQHNQKGILRTQEDLDSFTEILQSPLMKSEDSALGFESRVLHYKIFATYFFMVRDYKSAYRYMQQLIDYLEQESDIARAEPRIYINAILNFLNLSDALEIYDHHEDYLAKLNSLEEIQKSDVLAMQVFEGYYYQKLKLLLSTQNFKSAPTLLQELTEGMQKYQDKMNNVSYQMLCFYAAKVCYAMQKVKNAKLWLANIAHPQFEKARPDIYFFSHLIYVICLFESSDKLLPQELRRSYKIVTQKNQPTQFDLLLIQFYRGLTQVKTNHAWNEYLLKNKKQFLQILKDPFENKALSYFEFDKWLDLQAK